MRLLMVGPWRMTAMRRHIDWAVDSGIEVCVADFQPPKETVVPSTFRLGPMLPSRVKALHQPRVHRDNWRVKRVAALRLRNIAAVFQPDVIHSYKLDWHTDICLNVGIKPLVVSAWGHLNGLITGKITAKDRSWLRRLRQGAHTLLVENPNLADALARRKIDPLHLECFSIGVDSSLFHPDNQEKAAAWRFVLNIPEDATVLLSPRGWSQTYGQQHIMQAFAKAYRRSEQPLVLVLLGMGRMKRPDRLAQETLDLSVNLGVGQAIRWIPQVPYEDMPGVYALADIVINYPRSDAFPSTVLEAAACARPVITSALPAYRGTFVERYCTLVEPENPQALAGAIADMVAVGPVTRLAQARVAREAVLVEHDEAIQRRRLISLYHAITEDTPHRSTPSARDLSSSARRGRIGFVMVGERQ